MHVCRRVMTREFCLLNAPRLRHRPVTRLICAMHDACHKFSMLCPCKVMHVGCFRQAAKLLLHAGACEVQEQPRAAPMLRLSWIGILNVMLNSVVKFGRSELLDLKRAVQIKRYNVVTTLMNSTNVTVFLLHYLLHCLRNSAHPISTSRFRSNSPYEMLWHYSPVTLLCNVGGYVSV